MGLSSDQLIVERGSIYIVTSGSGVLAGTERTDTSTTASFTISFTGPYATGSKLVGSTTASFTEFWSVQDPNKHVFKIFWRLTSKIIQHTIRDIFCICIVVVVR